MKVSCGSVLDTWLVPSAARASKAACSGDVSGTVLSSYNGQLTVVTFDWIHRKQTHPKCDKVWRKRSRARMSHIWSKQEIVARTGRAALAGEDEQSVQGAVLVPPSNASFSSFFMCCYWRGCLSKE